jgi:hypothetical protein
MQTTAAPSTTTSTSSKPSLSWLWLLLTSSMVLLLMFHFAALIPVGVVWAGAGIARRLTATDERNRAAGRGLTVAGLVLAGVSLLIFLTLLGTAEPTLIDGGVVDEVHQTLAD